MTSYAPVSSRNVISAVYQLGDRNLHDWPTAARIARYLKADESEVLKHLRDLRRERIFRSRVRKGETVWMPWEAS